MEFFVDCFICFEYFHLIEDSKENRFNNEKDDYAADHMSDINIVGRVVLNLWRILRHQVSVGRANFAFILCDVKSF